ncbi:MAG: SIS domain-containing protein [Planctomycetota bacterium]|nr:MAG: SIS domain-containing protein [Planctomycetota bacterium]
MLGIDLDLQAYLERCSDVLRSLDAEAIERLAADIHQAYREGRTLFICGNGGSGANASHFCEDLGKSTLSREEFDDDRIPRLKVMSLTDNTPYILAWANDEGFDRIFVEQLKNFAAAGDLVLAISGSGNSPNVLRAVEWANEHGLKTWGMTGYDGGRLKQIAHDVVHVPLDDMGMVESIHLTVFHWILNDVYARIHRVGRYAPAGRRAAG